jgi:tetratricopeptide (TPR) repeat protein
LLYDRNITAGGKAGPGLISMESVDTNTPSSPSEAPIGTASAEVHKPVKRSRRLLVIVVLGVIAIATGMAVRNSPWARERALKSLNVDELALAAHDSPNDLLTFMTYGDKLMKAGNEEADPNLKADYFSASALVFERATKIDPKNARAYLGLAAALFRSQQLREASEAFKQAIKLDPKLPDAYLGLAQVYFLAGSPKRAIEPMKKLTELQPRNAVAWYTLGQIYGDAHLSDLALEAMKKATEIDPKKPVYWRSLGRLSQHYSRLKEAEEQYINCLKLDENDAVAYLWLGQLYMQMGDTPKLRGKAEAVLHFAVSRQPEMAEGYFGLGQLYERRGIWDMAVLNFQKAHDFNPSDDQALYHLGRCLLKVGKTAEGNKLILASKELGSVSREIKNLENRSLAEPNNRDLRLRLARLYRKHGNTEGAVARYKEYMSMGPVDPAVDKETKVYRGQLAREAAAETAASAGPKASPQSP